MAGMSYNVMMSLFARSITLGRRTRQQPVYSGLSSSSRAAAISDVIGERRAPVLRIDDVKPRIVPGQRWINCFTMNETARVTTHDLHWRYLLRINSVQACSLIV